MTWPRVQNVLYHAPSTITGAGRLILVAIADRTPGKDPRVLECVEMSRCDLALAAATPEKNIRQAVALLGKHGVEIRVPLSRDKVGNPVYAVNGRVPRWRVPHFPPLIDDCPCQECWAVRSQAVTMLEAPTFGGAYEQAPKAGQGAYQESEGAYFEPQGAYKKPLGAYQEAPLQKQINQPTESVALTDHPPTPSAPASTRGEEENSQKAEKILNRAGHQLTPTDRNRVHTAIVDALNTGHPETAILDALTKPTAGLNQIGAGLAARLNGLGTPPPPPPPGSMTRDEAKQQPPCRHGIAGGWCLNASCGQPWCPQCRRDLTEGRPIGPTDPESEPQPVAATAGHSKDFKWLLSTAAANLDANREPAQTSRRIRPGQGLCIDCADLNELREAATPDGSYCAIHEPVGALR